MTVQQSVKTENKILQIKRVLRRLISTPAMTPEEWQRLESKKQIKTSEQVRSYMRIH